MRANHRESHYKLIFMGKTLFTPEQGRLCAKYKAEGTQVQIHALRAATMQQQRRPHSPECYLSTLATSRLPLLLPVYRRH